MLSNYPDGLSDYTPGAPWNEPEVPEKDFEVTCSQSLSKTVTVTTNNYIPGESGCDYEPDGEGGYCACCWHDPDDTSDTNWKHEYEESGHLTPLELITLLKEALEKDLLNVEDVAVATNQDKKVLERGLRFLIKECDGWTEDETEFSE